MKKQKGFSLIELIIYSGVITVCLAVLYGYYIQIAFQKLEQISGSMMLINGQRAINQINMSVKQAQVVNQPSLNTTGNNLILDSGAISFGVNENKQLVKNFNGEENEVTDSEVKIDELIFTREGLATESGTIKINFTIKAASLINGKEKWEKFQTAVTVR
jgi:Tfp pilus assembly major pilin PilA